MLTTELNEFLHNKREEIEESMREFWGHDYNCTFYHHLVDDIECVKQDHEEYCNYHFGSSYEHGDFYTILYFFPDPETPEIDLLLSRNKTVSQEEVYQLFCFLLDPYK